MSVDVRWMIRKDMPQVIDVENASFDRPWNEEHFIEVLRNRNCIGLVAEHRERVAGYVIYELHYQRLHIMALAVHPDYRRQGVATKIIDSLKRKLGVNKRNRITLEVRETNLEAQLFFRAAGFRAVEVLRGFYTEDSNEDAYVFRYHCVEAAHAV